MKVTHPETNAVADGRIYVAKLPDRNMKGLRGQEMEVVIDKVARDSCLAEIVFK